MCKSRTIPALILACAQATSATAATLNVTSTSAGSNVMTACALRDAIQAVNTLAPVGKCPAGDGGNAVNTINIGVDAIAFSSVDSHSEGAALPALVSGRLLNIFGKAMTRTTLLVASACDHEFVFSERLLEVKSGAVLNIADVDFSGGCPDPNDALGGSGGAIANYGTLYLTRSTLSQNAAYGVVVFGGNQYNPGAAIYSGADARLSVSNATFDSNEGDGAVFVANDDTGYALVEASTFSGNLGGAIDNYGAAVITNVTFFGNVGVPISLLGPFPGGAINNRAGATLSLSFATLLDNPSPALELNGSSTAFMRSNIFGTPASEAATQGTNCDVASGANAYWSGVSISFDATCAGGANLVSTDPHLDTGLADNGGPTQTLKLLSGSPAFGRDSDCLDAAGDPVTADQRGRPRPATHCDAGAFEGDLIFAGGFDG